LKGAARAWARRDPQTPSGQIDMIFGFLNSQRGQAAQVEILDAFPVKASLSTDVSTPQWHWKNENSVQYKPEPHYLLSLHEAEITIAVRPTKQQYSHHVPTVVRWLKGALSCGIGSRVSGGYGQAVSTSSTDTINPYTWQTNFQIWTQGMYGPEAPTKANQQRGIAEFRPTALRGMLRYWFRAVALGLYAPSVVKELETKAFGDLSIPGAISLKAVFESNAQKDPYCYQGCLQLEASSPEFLEVAQQLTILAAHLGGFGRGTRRPLHLLKGKGKIRGCHWELDLSDFPLPYEEAAWRKMLLDVKEAIRSLDSRSTPTTFNPGCPEKRLQDVLDRDSRIWLIQSTDQIHPKQVKDWQKDGSKPSVRGEALNWFYAKTNPYFKGKTRPPTKEEKDDQHIEGNANVGGKLGTPSFVWIRSLFPAKQQPYQVVTLFGVNSHLDRKKFSEKLLQEFKGQVKTIHLPS
jgi:CRISPR-associated protein Cmr6